MADATCSIDGCDRPHRARGWCAMHYKRWQRNGDPVVVQYIQGDDRRRFYAKVDKTEICWLWLGEIIWSGYGRFWKDGRRQAAHRVSWEMERGPIPDGLVIDHLCRNRACVNPEHLEPVTSRENTLRGDTIPARNAAKAECIRGHPLDEDNTYRYHSERLCRECRRVNWRKWNAKRGMGSAGWLA